MAKIKRILLECTHTFESNLNTGIQRVVRNIIKESEQIGHEIGVKCQPVIVTGKHLLFFSKIKDGRSLGAVIMEFLKKVYSKLRVVFYYIFPFRTINRFLFPTFCRSCLLNTIKLIVNFICFSITRISYFSIERIVPHEGDVVLLLDSSWVYPIWPAVRKAKKKNAIIGLVVYDIIQITHPQFFEPFVVKRFQKWIDKSIDNVDFFIAISKTVRDQIASYIASNYSCETDLSQIESFQLGSVMDNVEKDGCVRDELREFLKQRSKSNTYLTVGTIEPRKNNKYVMDSFEKIWQQCPDARLCVVGHTSWLDEELPRRIKAHQKYGKLLFMLNDASDTELDYCYSHTKALIFPSHAEGFGLPIVESLRHGLPVLASDIPIHRETGKDFCAYFDISDPDSLAKIITNIEKGGKMPKVLEPEEYQLLSWKDSCRELLSKAVALYEKM